MKKSEFFILPLFGAFAVSSFLVWAFSLHGTIGLFRVNGIFHLLFILAGLLGLMLLAFSGLYMWDRSRKLRHLSAWLNIPVSALSLLSIIVPSAAFIYTDDVFASGIGNTSPQLIIADGMGSFGIPNLALTFNTGSPTKNKVEWGPVNTEQLSLVQESESVTGHAFMLKDLVPETRYEYSINGTVPVYFNSPSNNGTIHFAVGSDAHFGAADASRTATAAIIGQIADPSNNYGMFFFLGDLVEYGFSRNQWQQAFNSFSTATSTVPIRYIPGNHDTLFAGFQNYQSFCYPSGMDLQSGSRVWYRIDIGKIHFLCLDVEWSAESITQTQLTWLQTQLQDIPPDDWKIVMCHGFYYASGSITDGWRWYDNQETIAKLGPLFEQYKVDLVFSGHDHQLELLQHNGATYAVCGAFGGAPDQPRTYTSPASLWYANGSYGFADVTINGANCILNIRNPDSEILESLTLTKQYTG